MPTFGVSPTNFKEFIVALHGLRHQEAGEATKKRDIKAQQKEKKTLQNRMVLQFAVSDAPGVLTRLMQKLVSGDHDNKWLHQTPYLEYCLVDTDRVMFKSLLLVTLTIYLAFNVARTHLKTVTGRYCGEINGHMAARDHTVNITQVFDLRKYGNTLASLICESTNRVASDDRVNFSFFSSNGQNQGSSSAFLISKPKQKTPPLDFEGSDKVKANVMNRFQYLCWKYVAQVMEFMGGQREAGQPTTHTIKLRRWKRLQSHTVICQAMAFSALESERHNGTHDRHVLTPSNIQLKLITWQQDFRLLLSEHMHAEEDSIVHPHPIIGYQPPQNGMQPLELSKRQKVFDPWYHGIEYCLPALATLAQVSRQIFLDDRDRKNTDGTTMLLGEAGSGKTRLLKAVVDKFNGYLWQKKGSNFQSKTIETKSVVLVDEFDNQSLTKEQIHNEWKQRFDQEHSAYCDRKGVPGSNCTKHMPFFVTTNANMQWFRKNYDQALRRRILFIQFHRSHAQFENAVNVSKIKQRVIDTHEDECILSDQMANTVLLLGLFRPPNDSERQYFTDPIVSHLVLVVLASIHSPLLRVLGNSSLRTEFYDIISKFTTTDQHISGLDHQGIYQQLYKPNNCSYRLLRVMGSANGVFQEELDFQQVVTQLQKDPFRDLGQYQTYPNRISSMFDPFFENDLNNPDASDLKKLLGLVKELPKTEIARSFAAKVKELMTTLSEQEPVQAEPKPLSDEEYDKFFKTE